MCGALGCDRGRLTALACPTCRNLNDRVTEVAEKLVSGSSSHPSPLSLLVPYESNSTDSCLPHSSSLCAGGDGPQH